MENVDSEPVPLTSRLDRDVAIKVLPAGLAADPERVARFEQEARAAAALNHPNMRRHGRTRSLL